MLNAVKRFRGGIHPEPFKTTQDMESVVMPIPELVTIPMRQHIGAECKAIVKKGDYVYVGQVIADSQSAMSAPIHASVSGTVQAVKHAPSANGEHIMSVQIRADGLQTASPDLAAVSSRDASDMIQAVRDSGLVGLGGAGFPTYFKLTPPPGDRFDVLLINGAECEPYITSDYREMVENPMAVINGILLVLQMTGIPKAIVGIEDNKQAAIDRLIKACEFHDSIRIMKLPTRYPQGGEKQLIYAMTGRKISSGKLPSSIGVLVLSVNTVSSIEEYFRTGMPLVRRRVTIAGSGIKNPQNVWAPIGTHLRDVFDFCGGFTCPPSQVIMGGPMMGVAQFSPDNTILKQTNAVLVFTDKEVHLSPESACIRCGRCVGACPMRLQPFELNLQINNENYHEAVALHLLDCIECGCCSYVCPASRYLVQSFRFGKAKYRHAQVRSRLMQDAQMAAEAKNIELEPAADKEDENE